MPTRRMAALVTRLADHLLIRVDERVIECDEGGNDDRGAPGRSASLGGDCHRYPGLHLVAAMPFEDVRGGDIRRIVLDWGGPF
jgi:hypothetical protein